MSRRGCTRVTTAMAVVVCLTLAACTVPSQREATDPAKLAITTERVDAVYATYRDIRDAAVEVLDPKPLSVVERGAVLAIDSGAFEVAQQGSVEPPTTPDLRVDQLVVPRFEQYPLWFVSVASAPGAATRRVQVFERERAVDPWFLVASPEIVATTELPRLRTSGEATGVAVDPTSAAGMPLSAQEAAEAYTRALTSPEGDPAIAEDDFIAQMRDAAAQNAALPDVQFSQAWQVEDVQHVLRTADGGALAFVTLLRTDTYEVTPGRTVTWPEGTAQRAFLADGITGTGGLRFNHQVLLQIPAGSTGKPRAIGQFGGVIGAS